MSAIDDTYVVEVREGSSLPNTTPAYIPERYFTSAVNGFSAVLTSAQLAALQKDPDVVAISQDYYRSFVASTIQWPAPWNLDRIDDQQIFGSLGAYKYTSTGNNVHAYIIDSGIDVSHPDFGGRATNDFNATFGSNRSDCLGHGTAVAGIVGGTEFGVAKNVRLHGVKWLGCSGSGSLSGAIAAVDWVTGNATKPAIANASWNMYSNTTLEAALRNMIKSGVFLAAAAGNKGRTDCDTLPNKIETAFVTAATKTYLADDSNLDVRASYSSTGPCVDIYAPGDRIYAPKLGGGSERRSGTSMASPHVAGVAALYLQTRPTALPATVKSRIESWATPGVIDDNPADTANRLLYTNGL